MTLESVFNNLFSGGNFTLPYLLKFRLSEEDTEPLCFVNSNASVSYDDEIYYPCSFDYEPPDSNMKGASLSITGIDNGLIEFIDEADEQYILDVVGVINKDGDVQPIHLYKHFYGSVSYGEDMKLDFTLEGDDRMDMQFCPYTFDTDNNRGNA